MNTLINTDEYKKVTNDPTTYLEKTTKAHINKSKLPSDVKSTLIPREKSSRIPKIYGLPKIHKPEVPLRPIVSAYNCPTQRLAKYLSGILQPIVEISQSHIENSYHFINRIKEFNISNTDILVSFDIVSLFTNIPIDETLTILKNKHNMSQDILILIKHCMSNTYFTFQNSFYRQIKGAPMGSPLSPAIANIFMDDFETKALSSATLKPSCWLRYVDDTFVIWPHGKETLDFFLTHLNEIHPNIRFTMEIESNSSLPFLDVRLTKKPQQGFSYTVYRKPTHTNRYLNAKSHHHPSQLNSVVNTLISRSIRLTDDNNRHRELQGVKQALIQNGYTSSHIDRNIQKQLHNSTEKRNKPQDTETPSSKVFFPYIKGVTDKISRVFKTANIKTIFTTEQKLSHLIRSTKDNIPNENHGVYEIPCSACPRSYIGETSKQIHFRAYQHSLSVKNRDPSSALAQHFIQTGHSIDFQKTKTIAPVRAKTSRFIREAIEIEKRPNCLNIKDDSRKLNPIWKPLLPTITPQDTPQPSFPPTEISPPINTLRNEQVTNLRNTSRTKVIKKPPTHTSGINTSVELSDPLLSSGSRQIETLIPHQTSTWGVGRLRPRSRHS